MNTPQDRKGPSTERLAFSVTEVLAMTGIGRDKLYGAIRERELRAKKFGRRTLILNSDLQQWLDQLPAMGG